MPKDLNQPFHTRAAESMGGMDASKTFCEDRQDGIDHPNLLQPSL